MPSGNLDLSVTSRCRSLHCFQHQRRRLTDSRPAGCAQRHNGDASAGHVLLVLEVGVGSHQDIEPVFLGQLKELSVLEPRPTSLVGRRSLVARERLAQGNRSSLVEEDLHLCSGHRAAGGVLQDGARLRQRDAREPLEELLNRNVVLEVLEEGCHRDSGAAKHPCPAEPFGVSLDGWAAGPIDHAGNSNTATRKQGVPSAAPGPPAGSALRHRLRPGRQVSRPLVRGAWLGRQHRQLVARAQKLDPLRVRS